MEQITAIHITESSIRIASGGFNKFGKLAVKKTAYIPDADRFFVDRRLVYLRDMVSAVATVMKEERILCKTLSICYEAEGVETEFIARELAPKRGQVDLKRIFAKKDSSDQQPKERKEKKRKIEISNGTITRRQSWGDYTVRNKGGSIHTLSTADYDLIVALTNEFTEKGFAVKSIEGIGTALMYLKHSYPYSYDNMSQLLINVGTAGRATVYTFTKNIPSKVDDRLVTGEGYEGMAESIATICEAEVKGEGHRRPVVVLGGDGIRSYTGYNIIANRLMEQGYTVYDIYDYFEENGMKEAVKIQIDGDSTPDRCGLFTACISLLFRTLDANPENLSMRSIRKSSITKLQMLSHTVSILMGVFLILSIVLLGMRGLNVMEIRSTMVDTTIQNATYSSVLSEKTTASEQLASLEYDDERISNLLNLVTDIVPSGVHIISVDTEGTIPSTEATSELAITSELEEAEEDSTVTVATLAATAENIIVRGFATSSHLPVELYEDCVAAGIGDFELVGTKEVELPNGDTLYAFELVLRAGGAL